MQYYIHQLGDKDCGYTSVKMLMAHIYKRNDFLYYPEPSISTSTSLRDLMSYAKKEGVSLGAFRAINKGMFFKEKKKLILIPIKENDKFHMVMVKKMMRKKSLLYDPVAGIRYISNKKLIDIWDGEYLEVLNVEGSSFSLRKMRIIPKFFTVLTMIFEFMSFSSLIVALYFIDGTIPFYISLGLFISYIIFEFIYRKMLIQSMKYFDKHTMVGEFALNRQDFKSRYANMTQFKVLAISNPIQLFSLVLMCLLGIIVLGMNSLYNLISVATIFLFQLLFKFFENYQMEYRHNKINVIENDLDSLSRTSNKTFLSKIEELNNETYRFVSFCNFKKYLMIFLVIAMSLLYCGLSNNYSVNFMLFHFFFYLYINDDFEKIINFSKNNEDFKYYKALYLYYFNKY